MVPAGQNISQIDSLFVGDILGKKSDIADGSLRDYEFSKFDHIVGDYYIAPRFLDNMAVSELINSYTKLFKFTSFALLWHFPSRLGVVELCSNIQAACTVGKPLLLAANGCTPVCAMCVIHPVHMCPVITITLSSMCVPGNTSLRVTYQPSGCCIQ